MTSPTSNELQQLTLVASPYCGSCPANHVCHERTSARGCLPDRPPHPNLLHPSNPDWIERFAEIDGVDFNVSRFHAAHVPELPRYIPRIRLGSQLLGADVPGLAVSLREVERLAGKVRAQNRSAKEILGLTNDRLLIVLGFETDLFLEQAWQPERRRAILTAIQAVRPDLTVAWGYSVWHQHSDGWAYPRITQLHNMKRSLRVYEDLRRFDLPSIPHVYWGDTDDILRWARWLSSTPAISAIAIDLQTADSSVNWALALRGLATIRQAVPTNICLLVNGPCSAARVQAIDNVWPGCTLTNFGAYFSALYPRKPMYGLRAAWAEKLSLTPKAVFCHVVEEYTALLGDRSRVIQPPSWDDWSVPTRGLGTEPVNERYVLRNGGQLRLPLPTPSATTTVGRK